MASHTVLRGTHIHMYVCTHTSTLPPTPTPSPHMVHLQERVVEPHKLLRPALLLLALLHAPNQKEGSANAVGQFDVCDVALDVSKMGLLGLSLGRPSFFLPLQGREGRGEGSRVGRRRGGEGERGNRESEEGRVQNEKQDDCFIQV